MAFLGGLFGRKKKRKEAPPPPPPPPPPVLGLPIPPSLPATIVGAMQALAERGTEAAYRQGLEATMRQLQARGLARSGITAGALFNLGEQFAQQMADTRSRVAATAAEMQLSLLDRLLGAMQSREALLMQLAASQPQASALQQAASTQLATLSDALMGALMLFRMPRNSPMPGTTPFMPPGMGLLPSPLYTPYLPSPR